jgi:hypothetical protein
MPCFIQFQRSAERCRALASFLHRVKRLQEDKILRGVGGNHVNRKEELDQHLEERQESQCGQGRSFDGSREPGHNEISAVVEVVEKARADNEAVEETGTDDQVVKKAGAND